MSERPCPHCGRGAPEVQFYQRANGGRASWCKPCQAALQSGRRADGRIPPPLSWHRATITMAQGERDVLFRLVRTRRRSRQRVLRELLAPAPPGMIRNVHGELRQPGEWEETA